VNVHLVDGTYELFRAFYGAPRVTHAGREVGATRALIGMMKALLAEPGVTHVAVAFDHVIESFRNDLFAGYKTGDGIEPDLYSQFELAEEACSACGLVVWSMIEFEADDALATGAYLYAQDPQVQQVVLCTPDKDMAQCVQGSRIVTWDRLRRKVYDEAAVIEKFGVPPASIPDYLALVGDTADGIPGVPRWGAKSAAQILAHYGHLENIPDVVAAWGVQVRGAAALAENLTAMREQARLYRTLATLRTDVPLQTPLEQLCYRGEDTARMQQLREQLGPATSRLETPPD
jgi:5'-3' exonuclease